MAGVLRSMAEGVRQDGTETDFSYINVVKGKPKAFHHDQAVLRTPPITKPQAFSLRFFCCPIARTNQVPGSQHRVTKETLQLRFVGSYRELPASFP